MYKVNYASEGYPMGEYSLDTEACSFNGSIRIDFREHSLTSNAGVLLLREADQRMDAICSLANRLIDHRDPKNIVHNFAISPRETRHERYSQSMKNIR